MHTEHRTERPQSSTLHKGSGYCLFVCASNKAAVEVIQHKGRISSSGSTLQEPYPGVSLLGDTGNSCFPRSKASDCSRNTNTPSCSSRMRCFSVQTKTAWKWKVFGSGGQILHSDVCCALLAGSAVPQERAVPGAAPNQGWSLQDTAGPCEPHSG